MADGEVKQKKRRISDVFKRKSKDNQEEIKTEVDGLDTKEKEGQIEDESRDKNVESTNTQDSHEKKKRKFGHGRLLSSRRKKSKSLVKEEKSETQSLKGAEDETLATDGDKAETLEKEEEEEEEVAEEEEKEEVVEEKEEVVEEEGSNEPLEDFEGNTLTFEVQNAQVNCDTPEVVMQSDNKGTAVQTRDIVIENNEQLENDLRLKVEQLRSEEGSVIRSLLRQDVPIEEDKTEEPQDSAKQEQEEDKRKSNEISRFIPNICIANVLENIIYGSKSNNTGNPPETMYRLVLQTADQTYSTLVNLIYALLTRARQIPREVLVSFLIYLVKKYPQCFKIKKVKRKRNRPDSEVPVDTVN